ncbi:MAG: potassium channel family protein [Salibacteraceae bacterium]
MFAFSFKYFGGLYKGIAFLSAVLVLGTLGYVVIEQYSVIEGFYMTLITVSTVGYGEIRPLSDEGRLFTSALIISSFGTYAYVATSVGSTLLSGRYKEFYKNFRLEKKIKELKGHTIVCGFGNNGEAAIARLKDHNRGFVVIEKIEGKLDILKEHAELLYIDGDATDENNILRAGIAHADSLITTLPSDADNVFVCLTARQLNPNLTIISRATNPKSESKLKLAGADNVILPDRVGGSHMASLVTTPDINEFLDKLSLSNKHSVNLEEIVFGLPDYSMTVSQVGQLENGYVRILGIKNSNQEYLINPRPDQKIESGAKLFVLGEHPIIESLRSQLLN